MVKPLEYNATLVERIDLEPTLAVFRVRCDEETGVGGEPWFVPGQYVTIGLNRSNIDDVSDTRPVSVRRPMSVASASDDPLVEMYIRYVSTPESELPLTHLLWPLQVGDRLFCRPVATGKFTVRDTVGDDTDRILKVCVAAGTGLAPFLSMLRSHVRQDPTRTLEDFAVLHGASYPSSLGYREELETLARDKGLRYMPTVSRPGQAGEWAGATGRVESLLEPARIEETERGLGLQPGSLMPGKAAVLICGLNGTIANVIIHLLARGFVPDHRRIRRALEIADEFDAGVFWEQYDTTPVIDVKDEVLMTALRATWTAAAPANTRTPA